MKSICVFTALSLFSLYASAQFKVKEKPLLPGLNRKITIADYQPPMQIKPFVNLQPVVRKLPQDNMPCLVPDLASVVYMPTQKADLANSFIPNPYFDYHNTTGINNMPPADSTNSLSK